MLVLNNLRVDYITESKNKSEVWEKQIVIEAGEHTIISAPSGSGKSTLCNLLAGLNVKGSKGVITYADVPIKRHLQYYRRAQISTVYQHLQLAEDYTAMQNIEIARQLAPAVSNTEMTQIAAEMGIGSLLERKVFTLSMGERQRVAILRALVKVHKILILDEPFSHLDSNSIESVLKVIKTSLQRTRATVVFLSLDDDYGFWGTDGFKKILKL